MKKGDAAEFSAKWWNKCQPRELASAAKVEKALKSYEACQAKLKSAAGHDALKEALAALDEVEAAVKLAIAEAKKGKGNPELVLTAEVLGRMDFSAERKAAEAAAKDTDDDEEDDAGGLGDAAAFKLLLTKSLRRLANGPLHFGFIAGKKAINHRLVLSASKAGHGLATAAARELGLNLFTFGVARSSEEHPEAILLHLEGRQLPGLARKGSRMLSAFKVHPYTRFILLVEGKEVQDILDEADEDTDEQASGAEAHAAPGSEAPAAPATAAPAATATTATTAATASEVHAAPTAGQLRAVMERLTPSLRDAMAASPEHREVLMGLTRQFVTLLGSNDTAQAARVLQQILEAIGHPTSAATPNAAAPKASEPVGAVAFGKLRLEWEATKKSVAGDLARLKSQAAQEYSGDPLLDALEALDGVIARFNEGLGDRLDDIANAGDTAARRQAAQAAESIASSYLTYVDGDPLINLIEINPVAPITVAAPLEATLSRIRDALATLAA